MDKDFFLRFLHPCWTCSHIISGDRETEERATNRKEEEEESATNRKEEDEVIILVNNSVGMLI